MKPQHILAVNSECAAARQSSTLTGAAIYPDAPIDGADLFILQRERAEKDVAFRHLIPYTVLMNQHGEILVYERGAKVGESRLAGMQSVGFGGHIDLADVCYADSVIDLERTIKASCVRELHEELGIHDFDFVIDRVGMIIDNSNSVGLVHLGLFELAHFSGESQNVRIREEELSLVGWYHPSDINLDALEPWSRACVEFMTACDNKDESVDGAEWVEGFIGEPGQPVETITDIDAVLKLSCWGRFQKAMGIS